MGAGRKTMSKITAIEPQRRNPKRVNIYLDGKFAFGLTRRTAGLLVVGQDLSTEKVTALQADDTCEIVYQKALHFLSFRPRSIAEVHQNLANRGYSEDLIKETILRLEQTGLVNDREFARAWVENRNTFQPRGKSVLRMELRRKGLSDEIVDPLLDEQVDEESLAFEAARKYARRLAGMEWQDFRQKLSGFLTRRGFSYSTLSPIISEVWSEIQMADDGSILENKD
jgi:regulatory protein